MRGSVIARAFVYAAALILGSAYATAGQEKPPASSAAARGLLNLAVVIQGPVTFKRQGWTMSQAVVFGTNLQPGDLIEVGTGSVLKVVCSDLTLRQASAGKGPIPCRSEQTLLRRPDGSIIKPTRGGVVDGTFPVVLAPRKTRLLSGSPLLRWTAIPGVSSYRITVRGPDLQWQSAVPGTEIEYPASAPRLQPGRDYKLIVEAGESSSSREAGLGLGFSVVFDQERKSIENSREQIKKLGLPAGPTSFLIASLYAANGLNAEAIQLLESISPNFQVAAIERLLGSLYHTIFLPRQAEAHYLQSLESAAREGDEEGQMHTHVVLAEIYEHSLANNRLASQHLKDALQLAGEIGDIALSDEIKRNLLRLNGTGV